MSDPGPPPPQRRASLSAGPGRRGSVSKPSGSVITSASDKQPPPLVQSGRRSSIGLVQKELMNVDQLDKKQKQQKKGPSTFTTVMSEGNVVDEHSKQFKGELERLVEDTLGTRADLSLVVKQDRLSEYDRVVRRFNNFHFFLAFFSILVFMSEIWLAYDRPSCWPDGETEDSAARVASSWQICLKQNYKTYACKCMMSVSTLMLLISLAFYYRYQVKSEKGAHWFVHDSVAWRQHVWLFYLIEFIVILPHPYPTGLPIGDLSTHPRLYDDKFGAFMFLRSYLVLRVLRDHSQLYRRRLVMLTDRMLKKIGTVDFNWHLIIKLMFVANKWTFVVLGLVYVWFVMAYVIWIYEREHNYRFDLRTGIWLTSITMATVGYGDVVVVHPNSKVSAGIAAICGITITALLVYSVMASLERSPQDVRAINLLTRKRVLKAAKHYSAIYIQLWWRQYWAKSIEQGKRARGLPMPENLENPPKVLTYTSFNQHNNFYKAKLRECKREFSLAIDLEEMVGDRLDEKLDQITDVVAEGLAVRLGIDLQFDKSKKDRKYISLFELAGKSGVAFEDARRIRSKTEAIHKILIEGA